MAVKIKAWDEGFVHDCMVTLEKIHQIGEDKCEANFSIEYENKVLAQGYCFLPSDGKDIWDGRKVSRKVRFAIIFDGWGYPSIGATDIMYAGRWLSEQPLNSPDGEVLRSDGN